MTFRPKNTPRDLAAMMIKQAKILKEIGLLREAKELAQRAIAIRTMKPAMIRIR